MRTRNSTVQSGTVARVVSLARSSVTLRAAGVFTTILFLLRFWDFLRPPLDYAWYCSQTPGLSHVAVLTGDTYTLRLHQASSTEATSLWLSSYDATHTISIVCAGVTLRMPPRIRVYHYVFCFPFRWVPIC